MSCITCPNDGATMESDAYGVYSRRNLTYTCSECGYHEHR
ncbi:hypothetical protein HUW46_09251 [Amycolatopsis sp. CA-230715]|nr:hypothetical protein HUW46_09251 [Amycolatopsis sp. CA-230715]